MLQRTFCLTLSYTPSNKVKIFCGRSVSLNFKVGFLCVMVAAPQYIIFAPVCK